MITEGPRNFVVALFCAELLLALVRSREIKIIVKRHDQRTRLEQKESESGLLRGVILEALLFVPASVGLVWMGVRPVLLTSAAIRTFASDSQVGFCAWLGIGSYGFPFLMVRRLITRIALSTMNEFAAAVHHKDDALEKETPAPGTSRRRQPGD